MTLNSLNEEDDCGRMISIDIRKIGNCSFMVCGLQNSRRINLFLDGKGGYRIWTFLCSNFHARMWPTVIRLAEVFSPKGIKLEVTSELDLCCFIEGMCNMGSEDFDSLEAVLRQFVDAVTGNEECIMCLHKKSDTGAI